MGQCKNYLHLDENNYNYLDGYQEFLLLVTRIIVYVVVL